jgi:hypothetical protein
MSTVKALEHHEHAGHLAQPHLTHDDSRQHDASAAHGHTSQMAALLVAVLAASLAITEQAARHAEIRVEENAIYATDAWAQYQAKSTRATISKEVADIISVLDAGDAGLAERRRALLEQLRQAQDRFETDPEDGKKVIAARARAYEQERRHALEQTHAYHNGAAAMELGIVLATASAIIRAKPLILMALGVGLSGIAFAILGLLAPELGAL